MHTPANPASDQMPRAGGVHYYSDKIRAVQNEKQVQQAVSYIPANQIRKMAFYSRYLQA